MGSTISAHAQVLACKAKDALGGYELHEWCARYAAEMAGVQTNDPCEL